MNDDKGLVRPNYFTGKMLTAEDFTTEQSYFFQKLRRHDRYLHGWGVVSGLKVGVQDANVFVEPGLVIDCAGNEIYVTGRIERELPKDIDKLFVALAYGESNIDPIPTLTVSNPDGTTAQAYGRVREGYRLDILNINTNSGHEGMGQGTPGCGCQHPITIAGLTYQRKHWNVVPMGRR